MKEWKQVLTEEVLSKVSKPLRYLGNEYNAVKKNWETVKLHSLFAFPDVYEVGMSHMGLQSSMVWSMNSLNIRWSRYLHPGLILSDYGPGDTA